MAADVVLYEIAGSDGVSVSPFVWRIKFALALKGIPYRSKMLGLTDVSKQFEGRFQTAPIVDTGDRQLNESLAIADWLDEAHPDRLPIFTCPAERALVGFFDQWLLQVIVTGILPMYALDAYNKAAPHDRDYYRQSRELLFGRTLEDLVANREALLPDVRRSIDPVRQTITTQPFLGGQVPKFADMCMLGLFIFVGTIGTLPLLAADDPLIAYAERGFAFFPSETASLNLKLCEPARSS